VLEQGRLAGHVAGWIAEDGDGRALGWTYYLLHDGLLQIGGIVGRRPAVARALLDAALTSPEASMARGLQGFVFPEGTGVASALARQRFALRETRYLARDIGTVALERPADVRGWRDDDLAPAVRILASAYGDDPSAAAFAPDGRREQWAQYTFQLLRTPGCGRFDPALSVVSLSADGQARGVALATWISPDTVHLAQIAVLAEHRGQGGGAALVEAVLASARAAGARRVTLMVDGGNAAARRLYQRTGFVEHARLLFASRGARTRVAA
jgi:ribosomal protein S18 acetylase RimI-like enzyme